MRLTGKVALVTGASRGIGRATAELLAAEGARVVVHCRDRIDLAREVAAAIGPERAVAVAADISAEEGAERTVAAALTAFGRLDLLVNNAGILLRESHWTASADTWAQTLRTNVEGAWWMSKHAAAALAEDNGGAIVNVASIYGLVGSPAALSYSASKAGVIAITTALAKELAPDVRVNAVAPGNVLTNMTREAGAETTAEFDQQALLRRSAWPDEIARAILFLGSADASFVTGQVLVADGGYAIR